VPRAKTQEDPEIDDPFASPSPAEHNDEPPAPVARRTTEETAGESPRMPPRMLARTATSGNATALSPEEARKQRLRKRVKAPRQDKDQLNGRVPIFLIDAVRDWCDKQGITEIGEGMTILIETGVNVHDAEVVPTAYADRCVETGFYSDHVTAKERYASGEGQ
jgi:hypothetical protein